MTAGELARRVLTGRRAAPLRHHLAATAAAGAVLAAARGRRRRARLLGWLALSGWAVAYSRDRAEGLRDTEEHRARMRRLRVDVMTRFYIECIGSMEEEIGSWSEYDQRKHALRYDILARAVIRHAPRGGTVVDVGCASALVLDRVRPVLDTRGVGFDLSPYGVRQRGRRADPPVLAQAVVEHVPLRDATADVVVFSEVIEHLLDAYAGLREVSRITRPGGVMVLTTNNASETPTRSPLHDPLLWAERLLARRHPGVLSFRNITWPYPINESVDPLPREAPTHVPHLHFSVRELCELAEDAGFELVEPPSSFEFPVPQAASARRLRELTGRSPRLGNAVADAVERLATALPGVRQMGTHHLLVFRKVAEARALPRRPWWPTLLPADPAARPGTAG